MSKRGMEGSNARIRNMEGRLSSIFLIHETADVNSKIKKSFDDECDVVSFFLKKKKGFPFEYDLNNGDLINPKPRFDLAMASLRKFKATGSSDDG